MVLIKNSNDTKKELELIVNKMGITSLNNKEVRNIYTCKMLDISKPKRPEVKEYFQRKLESIYKES